MVYCRSFLPCWHLFSNLISIKSLVKQWCIFPTCVRSRNKIDSNPLFCFLSRGNYCVVPPVAFKLWLSQYSDCFYVALKDSTVETYSVRTGWTSTEFIIMLKQSLTVVLYLWLQSFSPFLGKFINCFRRSLVSRWLFLRVLQLLLSSSNFDRNFAYLTGFWRVAPLCAIQYVHIDKRLNSFKDWMSTCLEVNHRISDHGVVLFPIALLSSVLRTMFPAAWN